MKPPGSADPSTLPTRTNGGAPAAGSVLAPHAGESLVRLAETAAGVMRRTQFFVWSQGALSALLPHQALCCAAYSRPKRDLAFTAFHSVVLSPLALAPLSDAHSPLMQACAAAWVLGGGRALQLSASHLPLPAQEQLVRLNRELRGVQLLVHGVARPQRPAEIESLFVFLQGDGAEHALDERRLHAELAVPYLHATWRRVVAAESVLAVPGLPQATPVGDERGRAGAAAAGLALTERELEILRWAREGMSNLQIGEQLDISALTVKNHIQKILRKLGASNRAQAVAVAMAQGLL